MIYATQFVNKMRGDSEPLLLRCSDGLHYVVKFQGNPQHSRTLANTYLASKLASHLGLPIPPVNIIHVDQWLVDHSPEMKFVGNGTPLPVKGGLQVGSQYVSRSSDVRAFDYFPERMLHKVINIRAFAGMLAFDQWTSNTNPRQTVFWKTCQDCNYTVSFVGEGKCFKADHWSFPESTKIGIYMHETVYREIRGLTDFEPYLSRIENIAFSTIESVAREIPECWYGEWNQLLALIKELHNRRTVVRRLLSQCAQANPGAFRAWIHQGGSVGERKKPIGVRIMARPLAIYS